MNGVVKKILKNPPNSKILRSTYTILALWETLLVRLYGKEQ